MGQPKALPTRDHLPGSRRPGGVDPSIPLSAQLLQPLTVISPHFAVPIAPPMPGLLADPKVPTNRREVLTFTGQPLALTEFADYLLRRVSTRLGRLLLVLLRPPSGVGISQHLDNYTGSSHRESTNSTRQLYGIRRDLPIVTDRSRPSRISS